MNRHDQQVMRDYRRNLHALRPQPRWVAALILAVFFGGAVALINLTLDVLAAVTPVECWDAQDDSEIPPCGPGTVDPVTGAIRE